MFSRVQILVLRAKATVSFSIFKHTCTLVFPLRNMSLSRGRRRGVRNLKSKSQLIAKRSSCDSFRRTV